MLQGIAKKTCDVLFMLNSFHSVVIETPDLELGIREYRQLLGAGSPRIEVNAARQTRSALFSLQNMRLELRSSAANASIGAERPESAASMTGEPRLAGFRLAGSESGAIDQGLAARGVKVASIKQERGDRLETSAGEPSLEAAPRRFRSLEIDLAASRGLPLELVSEESPAWSPEVEEAGADPASIVALDHVVVFSAAPDSTRRFYEEDLGIRLALDRTFEKRGVRLLFFRIGGATIEIGGRLNAEVSEESLDRFGGLAWKVREIDAIAARLSEAGVNVSEVRPGNKAGTRVCTVRDQTQGVPTLLIEPVKATVDRESTRGAPTGGRA